ncbi:Iron-sulfur assembly protein 1 [Coniochaeta hoffmannii]|uniref:Iron-sulfur assembly protein 1 n=1 Tax=Coniochaeta hoffmannii TaxID=91930 RepID=A0AA38RQ78_9PEZI|nr:Iron-sulfur assembly protein 1 [Coniochaeta hoffmannii]
MNAPSLLSRRTFNVCLACRHNVLRRPFSSTSGRTLSFQSYPLNPQPESLPRNASVPDTSIAQPVQPPPLPKVHETRPPKEATKAATTSIPEQAAQTSQREFAEPDTAKPPPSSSSTTASAAHTSSPSKSASPAPAPKRSKLRAPRKAAMKLTPSAVSHLRNLLDQPEPKLIKVGVRNRGCSGLAYNLEYVDKPGMFDETVEQDGVKVLIDSKALFSIIGSEMDWVEDKLNQRFVFRNPNIKEQCGCGESFMV